jgi:hypothetical protein
MRSILVMIGGDAVSPVPLPAGRLRLRLLGLAVAYGIAAAVFAAVGAFGVNALANGLWAFGVAWCFAGFVTLGGAAANGLAALLARRAVVRETGVTGPTRATLIARCGRILMLVAATGAAAAGVFLAPPPGDPDRSLAITVNLYLAGAIALFALVTNDVTRAIRRSRKA